MIRENILSQKSLILNIHNNGEDNTANVHMIKNYIMKFKNIPVTNFQLRRTLKTINQNFNLKIVLKSKIPSQKWKNADDIKG